MKEKTPSYLCLDNEDDLYKDINFCDICKNFCCVFCHESGKIHVDECYECNKTICTECNESGDFLKNVWIRQCDEFDCYYCRNGGCYNNQIEWLCDTCVDTCDYKLVRSSSTNSSIF